MITVLIEENYAKNSRVGLILDGILSVTRRKRVAVEVYTDEKKIKSKPRVVVLICASLKWATEIIEKFNGLGIHPLLFGFQYIDTAFRYSCITLNYTQNTYLLTRYLLDKDAGETVFLGANKDSMTDRQKYIGMELAVKEAGTVYREVENKGDITACIDSFASDSDGVKNVVCSNDAVAIIFCTRYPEIAAKVNVCSCSAMKFSEYVQVKYPTAFVNYYKAGIQIAKLYLFLDKSEEINYSTFMMLEMDLNLNDGGEVRPFDPKGMAQSSKTGDFYGDPNVREVELLENMLLKCDEIDFAILKAIIADVPYEEIAEIENLAVNTVKYRMHAMLVNSGLQSKRRLVETLRFYGLKFD